ncbi:MAG: heat-shock protein [Bacteroidetes bacterium 47-18]|mgnify:CR=1 FL=1|nr:MAG: heat-shock protein [Bacteroidetes bacterium 47-18]
MLPSKRNEHFFSGIPKIFEDFFGSGLMDWKRDNFSSTSTTLPSVNIRETDNSYEVELAAPGMEKSDFNIELHGNRLVISSSRKAENETKEENYTRKEFSYQSFQRSFTLPEDNVIADDISARYENGLLQVHIPKKENGNQVAKRLIEIK